MSSMTMNMFARRIWAFNLSDAQAQVARQAGWGRADILWEGLAEAGNAAWAAGNRARAARLFRRAHWVALMFLPRHDLRRATSLANLGVVARSRGRAGRAQARFDAAAEIWAHADAAIETMQIAPRARSSLFHLRMEARHRETYHDNMRLRIGKIATETRAAFDDLASGRPPAHRLYARWLGEKPNVHDDTRKVLSACLLIPDGP